MIQFCETCERGIGFCLPVGLTCESLRSALFLVVRDYLAVLCGCIFYLVLCGVCSAFNGVLFNEQGKCCLAQVEILMYEG